MVLEGVVVLRNKEKVLILILVTLLMICSAPPVKANVNEREVSVSAQAAVLMDAESGRVLYEKNGHEPLRIASITKIMTAIIAIELGNLDDVVTVSPRASGVEGSSIYLVPGEKITLEALLYGLMLRSGNDAAVAIAEHIGGSEEGFVFLMNQKAAELGMTNTVFSNPHGLDTHEEHYSTAYDMAVLAAYAMQNETFATIVSTKRKTVPMAGEAWDRVWYNKNRLLSMYPYADGVKTGYTKRAGRTLVSSSTKDGHRLIAVTLNASNDWRDHMALFEYGYSHYDLTPLAEAGATVPHGELVRSDGQFKYLNSFKYPLRQDEQIRRKLVLAPVFQNETLDHIPYPAGYMYYYLDEEPIGRTPLVFQANDEQESYWRYFKKIFHSTLGVFHG